MEIGERRARLEALALSAESEFVQLRAHDLLAQLDARAEREPAATFDPEAFAREQAESEERLSHLVELLDECGLLAALPGYREHVEARARELVEEQAERHRAQFAEIRPDDADERGAESRSEDLRGPAEGDQSEEELEPESGPESAPEKANPMSPEVLARQWPGDQRSMISRWRKMT